MKRSLAPLGAGERVTDVLLGDGVPLLKPSEKHRQSLHTHTHTWVEDKDQSSKHAQTQTPSPTTHKEQEEEKRVTVS